MKQKPNVVDQANEAGLAFFIGAAFEAGWKAHLSRQPGETLLDHKRAYMAAVRQDDAPES